MKNIKGLVIISAFTVNFSSLVAQEITPPVLIRTEPNGINVYQSNGYQSKSINTTELTTEPVYRGIDNWSLEDCVYALSIIDDKIEVLLDLGDLKEIETYKKQKEELKARIVVLTTKK